MSGLLIVAAGLWLQLWIYNSSCREKASYRNWEERPRDLHAPSWKSFIRFCPSFTVFYGFFYANTICKITKPTAPELTDVLCWQFSLIFSGFSMPPCNTFSFCPPRKDQLSNIFYLFTTTSTSRPKVTLNLTSVDHLRRICIYIFLVATFGKHISHGTVWVKGKADSIILGWYLWAFESIITSSDLKFAVVCC